MFGTVALLSPQDQALIAGFVVNKFRGDPSLLSPGLDSLEKLTGRRVYGWPGARRWQRNALFAPIRRSMES